MNRARWWVCAAFVLGSGLAEAADVDLPLDGAWRPWVEAAAKEKAEKFEGVFSAEGADLRAAGRGRAMDVISITIGPRDIGVVSRLEAAQGR